MQNNSERLENFRILIEGDFDCLDVQSLFIEFKWLISKSNALFDFEIGNSGYDEFEEELHLDMIATCADGRSLRLTTDNYGQLCIDARTGLEIDMVAKLPRFDELQIEVAHVVLDFLNKDYGALYGDWYKEN